MRRIAFFEGPRPADLQPIAHLRPVFELRCGHFSVRERVLRAVPTPEWGVCLRSWLAEVYNEEHPEARINDEAWLRAGPTLFVDGRWLGDPRTLSELDPGCVGVLDDECVWVLVEPDEAAILDPSNPAEGLARIARTRKPIPAGGWLARHPWDLVHHNGKQLELDFHLRGGAWSRPVSEPQVALQGPPENLHVAPEATIDPFVVLDARGGPVWIEAGARLLPFTRVEGPCYIGRETQVFRAHVRAGTSIGPVCRVGGEIEESILHGHANKYHDGFLGHSYVCPWVNLGALTSNSDLKNDYSPVSVPLAGVSIPSGSTKVGCFIGDHTKTALSTLFNTGSSIGVMTMLLPGGELLPKHVPSFSRLWHGRLEALPDGIEPALAIARTAMGRRNCELTPAVERLLREIHRQTAGERKLAIDRQARTGDARVAVER